MGIDSHTCRRTFCQICWERHTVDTSPVPKLELEVALLVLAEVPDESALYWVEAVLLVLGLRRSVRRYPHRVQEETGNWDRQMRMRPCLWDGPSVL